MLLERCLGSGDDDNDDDGSIDLPSSDNGTVVIYQLTVMGHGGRWLRGC